VPIKAETLESVATNLVESLLVLGADQAALMPPQDVSVAVTVEVANALDCPIRSDAADDAASIQVYAIHEPNDDLPIVVAPEDVWIGGSSYSATVLNRTIWAHSGDAS